jgi:hypothetical protein
MDRMVAHTGYLIFARKIEQETDTSAVPEEGSLSKSD